MAKFKKGDRVIVIASTLVGGDKHIQTQDTIGLHGVINLVRSSRHYPNLVAFDNGHAGVSYQESDLELEEKSMENLEAGDVLENPGRSYTRFVMLVVGEYVMTADMDGSGESHCQSVTELKDDGWKLKGTEPGVKEVSMDEVAKALNVPVETLRIKKDD